MTDTIPTNAMTTMSTNSVGKSLRYKIDCYFLYTVLLVIISLVIIAIAYYHCKGKNALAQ